MISREESKRLKSQRTGYLLRSCLLAISDDVPIKPSSHDYLNGSKAMETTEEVSKVDRGNHKAATLQN